MKHQDFHQLFFEELSDMFSAENQIIESLPKLIKAASLPELKEALTHHLKETQHQVKRIEKIYSITNNSITENTCEAMEGLLAEADEMIKNKAKSPALDAAIICAAQKVEHYEIATYGTLRSFAKHLGFPSEVVELLQDSLDEEGAANKKLTKIADGTLFTSGVNQAAVDAEHTYEKSKR